MIKKALIHVIWKEPFAPNFQSLSWLICSSFYFLYLTFLFGNMQLSFVVLMDNKLGKLVMF